MKHALAKSNTSVEEVKRKFKAILLQCRNIDTDRNDCPTPAFDIQEYFPTNHLQIQLSIRMDPELELQHIFMSWNQSPDKFLILPYLIYLYPMIVYPTHILA